MGNTVRNLCRNVRIFRTLSNQDLQMLYLILAFCSSALITIVMRLGEGRIQNNISTLAVNYLVCLLFSLAYSAGSGSIAVPLPDGRMTVILGLISGAFYMGSFILYQYNIYRNGVLMSSTFMKLGVLVPTMIAIFAFGERPGVLQLIGICLAVAAIIIVNSGNGESVTVTAPKALIILLLVGGSGDAMSKFYEELGRPEFSSQYLLYTFAVALILCTMTVLLRGQKLSRSDVLFGCLIGIPNYYSARFLLLSLSEVPAVIAYPAFSVCTIILVGAAGVLVFKEKMSLKQWVGVAIIIAAMVLLNV